jgi:hypothetical protein
MALADDIGQARGDAATLEKLYRQALSAGEESTFKEAIREQFTEDPEDLLFSAWAYRLDIVAEESEVQPSRQQQALHWRTAIAGSIVLGVFFALCAGGKPPVPVPGVASPWFWIGWGPLTAVGLLSYLALMDRTQERMRLYMGQAAAVVLLALLAALTAWDRTDHLAGLIALHLPFVAWIAVGGTARAHPHPARQFHAFLVKSAETTLTAGVNVAAGALFMGLTLGIFAVLGIQLPETGLLIVSAWGIGTIPILALASVYDPSIAPIQQNWTTGLARILRILTRLILPLVLGVLAVYVFWFIPNYFWRPFQEREILIVYNATIMAVLALLAVALTSPDEGRSAAQDAVLRYALLAVGALTLLLNAYSLAAIADRTLQLGLTPNRYAVFGWNIATLLMLAGITFKLWRADQAWWVDAVRKSVARLMVPAIVWALWVLLILPLSFD